MAIPFGGYTGVNADRVECCGDDANEFTSVGSCIASTSSAVICCNSSNQYNLDGSCVPYPLCPDVMRTAPVWIEYPDASWSELAVVEAGLSNGYCCNSTPGGDNLVNRPLCLEGVAKGCYLEFGAVATNNPLARTYCSTEDECVLENIVPPDSPFSLCENTDSCTEETTRLDYDYLSSSLFCDDYYTPITDSVGCYKRYDGFSDVSDCTAVDVKTCHGSGCKVLCQESDGAISTCLEVCDHYSCHTETTYRGPESCTTSSDEICTTRTFVDVSSVDVGSCSPASFCNEFGCWANGCSPCTGAGCPSCSIPDVYTIDIVCEDSSYCNSYITPVGCVSNVTPQGLPLLIEKSDGEFLQCSPQSSVHEGDIWCPEGFLYEPLESRCVRDLEVCDFGMTGNLKHGCNNIINNADDFWGRYNSGCISAETTEALTLNAYDKSCCLNSVLNSYELYVDGKIDEFVKVY